MSDKEPEIRPQDTGEKGDVPFTPGQEVAAFNVVEAAKDAADGRRYGTISSEDYADLMRAHPDKYAVLDALDFTILEASDSWLEAMMAKRDEIIGRDAFEVLPDPPEDPDAPGQVMMRTSFDFVIEHRRPHHIPSLRYPVQRPDGSWDVRYWEIFSLPVPSDAAAVRYILVRIEDITELVTLRKESAELVEYQELRETVLKNGASRLMGTLKGVGYAALIAVIAVGLLFALSSLTGQSSLSDRVDHTTMLIQQQTARVDRNAQIVRDTTANIEQRVQRQTVLLQASISRTHKDLTVHAKAASRRNCATVHLLAAALKDAGISVANTDHLVRVACTFVPPP